jgi:hypothetical protein
MIIMLADGFGPAAATLARGVKSATAAAAAAAAAADDDGDASLFLDSMIQALHQTSNPKPQTPNPKPYTPNPKP